MPLAHEAGFYGASEFLVTVPLLIAAALYVYAYLRVRRRRVGWSLARLSCFLAGLAAVAVALLPPLASHDDQFAVHITQHLLLAMAAPLLLALSAPITLALRTLPPGGRRCLSRVLHARPLWLLSRPLVSSLLDFVPLYLLYLTPLYAYALTHPTVHELLHVHFLVAGCFFTWATVGVDPLPGRASVGARGAAIVLAFAAHGTIAKMMYAAGSNVAGVSVHSWRTGAQLMWYGGDAIEILLVLAFALQWYRVAGRRLERAGREGKEPTSTSASRRKARCTRRYLASGWLWPVRRLPRAAR